MTQIFTSWSHADIFRDGIREAAGNRLISCDIFVRSNGYEVVWHILP